MKTKIYLGLNSGKGEVFRAEKTPDIDSHGHRFAAVVGPFRTKRGAEFMRDFGFNNPHCRTVGEAERLAKKHCGEVVYVHGKAYSDMLAAIVGLLDACPRMSEDDPAASYVSQCCDEVRAALKKMPKHGNF